ncbi:glycosyltransferase family 2 protein [Timonella sp. A28]|uniref:glycosyltransferase family 2 protein n=1 Tax=Timonella sp. A28 TaxID=3442640 RepID=UPI003EBAEA5A
MREPLVSVVIPAKDQEPFIHTALMSVAGQRIGRDCVEVIVVNDGSTDDTMGVVESCASLFPLLTVIDSPQSRGVSWARNAGLRAATGEFVGFLDPDDWLGPQFLASTVRALRDLGVDFVRTDHTRHERGRRSVVRAPQAVRYEVLDPLAGIAECDSSTMIDYPFPWAGLFRRDVLVEHGVFFDESAATAEDREFMWQMHTCADSFSVISEAGVFYRRGVQGSLTQAFTEAQFGFVDAFTSVLLRLSSLTAGSRAFAVRDDLLRKACRQLWVITFFHVDRYRRSGLPAVQVRSMTALLYDRLQEVVLRWPEVVAALDVFPQPRRGVLLDFLREGAVTERMVQGAGK